MSANVAAFQNREEVVDQQSHYGIGTLASSLHAPPVLLHIPAIIPRVTCNVTRRLSIKTISIWVKHLAQQLIVLLEQRQ